VNEKLTNAIDKLLGVNTTAIVALGAVCSGLLYAGMVIGGIHSKLQLVVDGQTPDRLCERIRTCSTSSLGARELIYDMRIKLAEHDKLLQERGVRIDALQDQINRVKP